MAKTAIIEVLGNKKWVCSWSAVKQENTKFRPNVLQMLNAVAKYKSDDTKGINEAISEFAKNDEE